FEQQLATVALFKVEINDAGVAICRTDHVHLSLARASQGDGIQLATGTGLHIQRYQAQRRAVIGGGFERPAQQAAVRLLDALEADGGGDKALHQVAIRRADIGLVHIDTDLTQLLLQLQQLAVLAAVQAQHRTTPEVAQGKRTQLHALFIAQQWLGPGTLLGGYEGDSLLARQAYLTRAGI